MIWVALLIVLGQGAIIAALLYFVRTFGAYTDALLKTHESNVIVHRITLTAINELLVARQQPPIIPE